MKKQKHIRVKHRLLDKGISISQLAREIGISRTFVCALINGREKPTARSTELIASYLQTTVEDLFGTE